MNLWGSIPANLRSQNGGKGVPVAFHLSPISEFYKQIDDASSSPRSCTMEKKFEISSLKSVDKFVSSLESFEQRLTDIRTDSVRLRKNISKKMRNGLKDLEKFFSTNISSFRTEILDTLQEVRLESETVDALVERIGEFDAQLKDWLYRLQMLQEEMTEKLSLIQCLELNGYTVFGEGDKNALNDAKASASKDFHQVFLTFRFSPTTVGYTDCQEKKYSTC